MVNLGRLGFSALHCSSGSVEGRDLIDNVLVLTTSFGNPLHLGTNDNLVDGVTEEVEWKVPKSLVMLLEVALKTKLNGVKKVGLDGGGE